MTWKIGYYKKENGEIPVLDFLLTLEPKMRAKVVQYIDLLEKSGTNLREPYVAPIKGDTFVMLHGFKKKTTKTPSSELERALKYKLDFERRGTDE